MENQLDDKNLVHNLNDKVRQNAFGLPLFSALIVASIVLGIGVGYFANKIVQPKQNAAGQTTTSQSKQTVGIVDKKTFKDKAEGLLKEGGIDGEGSFHLERPGGESQNVYLTSTTVDLSKFVGKKVRVWGETFTAEKAGWLMDVGLVEVLQ